MHCYQRVSSLYLLTVNTNTYEMTQSIKISEDVYFLYNE